MVEPQHNALHGSGDDRDDWDDEDRALENAIWSPDLKQSTDIVLDTHTHGGLNGAEHRRASVESSTKGSHEYLASLAEGGSPKKGTTPSEHNWDLDE